MMQIETKKSKKPHYVAPIILKQEHDIEEENIETILIPSANILNKLIERTENSPQEFFVPMRFSAQDNLKDSDGFFIPLKKQVQKSKNQSQHSYQNDKYQLNLSDLNRLDDIGMGSSGTVQRAVHIPSQMMVALKNIQIVSDQNFTKQINLELQTLVSCDHINIIKCYGAFVEDSQITIALEYMNMGTLQDVIRKVGCIPQVMLGHIAYQVLKGLDYLHRTKKIIHRDIKPSNLLINSEGEVKISDFGVSGQLMNTKDQRSTWIGTVTYMSPERFRGESYSSDTDIWSLGLSLLECAWGQFPYPYPYSNESKNLGFWEMMEYVNQKPVPVAPSDYCQEMCDLINSCLQKEAGKRSSAFELLVIYIFIKQHPIIKQYEGVSLNYLKNWLDSLQ